MKRIPIQNVLIILLTIFNFSIGIAQDNGIYKGESILYTLGQSYLSPPVTNSVLIQHEFTSMSAYSPFFVRKGNLTVKADFGGNYVYGGPASGNNFDLQINFKIRFYNTPVPVPGAFTYESLVMIPVSNLKPEGLFYLNLSDHLNNLSTNGLNFTIVTVEEVGVTDITNPSYQPAVDNLSLQLFYELEYALGADPGIVNISLANNPSQVGTTKVYKFEWNSLKVYPNYQVQVLRLYNRGLATTTNPQIIDLTPPNVPFNGLNWDEALTLETESSQEELYLTMSEGTGGFAWRVRPVGTYYEGGISNSKNYGEWTAALPGTSIIDFSVPVLPSFLFWCNDPDEDKNFIYSRTFTEGNNMSEKITYANSLQQVRQSQAYIKSKNTKVTTQTIMDQSGRPAISTIPVPSNDPLAGYKDGFVIKDGSTELYNATHFDTDLNYRAPAQVKEINGFEYYSNANPDPSIADAEKYPYTRTIYENDGSGRVKEQSGIGKTHMIGDQNVDPDLNMGRTTRTFYGTPSQHELDKMFGLEAPKSGNVFKTVTVDPNNTASVTFTNKEGKVIATALTFDETNPDNVEVLEELADQTTDGGITSVVDDVTQNVKTEDGYISTKKLTILSQTDLYLDYKIKQTIIQSMCTNLTLECGFEVKVIIHNLDLGTKVDVTPVTLKCGSLNTDCTTDPDYIQTSFGSDHIQTLIPGNYLIEKIISKTGQANLSVSAAMDRVNIQIQPLAGWITSTLQQVNCEEELMTFYNDLHYLGTQFAILGSLQQNAGDPVTITFDPNDPNCQGCSGTSHTFGSDFMEVYNVNPSEFSLIVHTSVYPAFPTLPFTTSSGDLPDYVQIKTPCCGIMQVSVLYTPPFKCPTMYELDDLKQALTSNGDPYLLYKLDINDDMLLNPTAPGSLTNYLPDFEGYAVSMIKQCFDGSADPVQDAKNLLYSNMQGWHKRGMFNMMVYHMLVDQYSCENLGNCSSTTPVDCALPPPSTPLPTTGYNSNCEPGADPSYPCARYKCTDIANCWRGVVLTLMNANCPMEELEIGADGVNGKISEGFDEQNGDDTDKHDSHVDGNFDIGIPWPFGWFMETLMSARLRNKQNISSGNNGAQTVPQPTIKLNLVEQFLECTGYSFADVLNSATNGNPVMNSIETSSNPGNPYINDPCLITLDYDFDGNPANGEYSPDVFFANVGLLDDYNPGTSTFPSSLIDWQNSQAILYDPPATYELNRLGKKFFNIKNPIYAFKYFEYDYSSFNDLEISNCFRDPNDCYDSNGLLVPCCTPSPCYFCGMGIVICDKTKENWSCGQRYTWYSTIKNYTDGSEPVPALCIDNVKNDCDRISDAEIWYPDPACFDPVHNILSASEYISMTGNPPSGSPLTFEHLNNSLPDTDPISIAEIEAVKLKNRCENGCDSEQRRNEFKQKVIQMFTDRCYLIGGCKMSNDDNVVPEEDIDFIVEKLVEQCTSQCTMSTYACDMKYCRIISTPPDQVSNVSLGLNIQEDYTIHHGVGGVYDIYGTYPASTLVYPAVSSGVMQYSELQNDPFPYGEYALYQQALNWDFDLDIKSKCNDISSGIAQYTPPLLSGDPVYIYDKEQEIYVIQNFSVCTPQFTPPNQGMPNTAIPKSAYAVNPGNGPVDPNQASQVGDPVKTNKVGLNLITPP